MKIPSEAELIEMERRIASAELHAESLQAAAVFERRRIDPEDLDMLTEGYAQVAADLESLIDLVRAGALCAR
jgi:hypothetical protein